MLVSVDVEPHITAWADQFGALLRDKCRQIQDAIIATGWNNVSHEFHDPRDGERWRVSYREGYFWVTNLDQDEDHHVLLNIDALGVNRRV